MNVGRMIVGEPALWPCTPTGIMEMFREYGISLDGKVCVMVGRSNIVGRPMALLMLRANILAASALPSIIVAIVITSVLS